MLFFDRIFSSPPPPPPHSSVQTNFRFRKQSFFREKKRGGRTLWWSFGGGAGARFANKCSDALHGIWQNWHLGFGFFQKKKTFFLNWTLSNPALFSLSRTRCKQLFFCCYCTCLECAFADEPRKKERDNVTFSLFPFPMSGAQDFSGWLTPRFWVSVVLNVSFFWLGKLDKSHLQIAYFFPHGMYRTLFCSRELLLNFDFIDFIEVFYAFFPTDFQVFDPPHQVQRT